MVGVIELLNVTFAGVSTAFSMVSVWGQFRKMDEITIRRDELVEILNSAGMKRAGQVENEAALLELLRQATVIMAPVKTHLIMRLTLVLGAILGTSFMVPSDFTGQPFFGVPRMDILDPMIFLLQVVLAMATASNSLLSPSEQDFLRNVRDLHALFYREYVEPAIAAFLVKATQSGLLPAAKRAWQKEEQKVERMVDRILKRRGIGA